MSIADELREAAEEMAFSFTQEQWELALVDCWKKNTSIGFSLVCASGFSHSREITREEWSRLIVRALELKPSLSVNSRLSQPCRAWIASHATYANDAFWDGQFEKAKAFLKRGGIRARSGVSVRREVRKADKEVAGLMTVRVRERDTRTNWNVCK